MRTPYCAGLLCGLQFVLNGCGGNREAARPAPTYERWALPEWEPPETPEEDPMDGLSEMDGEWVTPDAEADAPPEGKEGAAKGSEDAPSDAESSSGAEPSRDANRKASGAGD